MFNEYQERILKGLEDLDDKEKELRLRVIKEAFSWVGTPYIPHAKIKGKGTDCAMLMVGIYETINALNGDEIIPDYSPDWSLHQNQELYLAKMMKYGKPTKMPKPGDVVMFRLGNAVSHAGIFICWPLIIHAMNERGVILDDFTNGRMKDRASMYFTAEWDRL